MHGLFCRVGLAIVPLLPVMFDHPVEYVRCLCNSRQFKAQAENITGLYIPQVTDKAFDYLEENVIGSTEEAKGARRKHHEAKVPSKEL